MNREAFEQWARTEEYEVFHDGAEYIDHITNCAWQGWQARQPEIDTLKENIKTVTGASARLAVKYEELEAEVERLRQRMDAPCFFLLGLSGSTSVPAVFRQAALMHHKSLDAAMREPK
jgi:hypothetical protein